VTTRATAGQDRSELAVSALLLLLGGLALWNALQLETGVAQTGPVGPAAVPVLVGVLLVGCAVVLAWDVLRGGHGEAEGGEDVDLSHSSDRRTVLLLVAAFLANVVLIDRAGWAISGAILFWGCAYALGSRHYIRDALISVAMSVGTFYLFAVGLGIALPAGWLTGIL
jgi:putative tricarboxylic transport membrane protein